MESNALCFNCFLFCASVGWNAASTAAGVVGRSGQRRRRRRRKPQAGAGRPIRLRRWRHVLRRMGGRQSARTRRLHWPQGSRRIFRFVELRIRGFRSVHLAWVSCYTLSYRITFQYSAPTQGINWRNPAGQPAGWPAGWTIHFSLYPSLLCFS